MARTGQSSLFKDAIRIVVPVRNGSVLLALIKMYIIVALLLKVMSKNRRCEVGSNLVGEGQVYSDTRRRPKKANSGAAWNIALSNGENPELDTNAKIRLKCSMVIGLLGGRDREDPCERLIPRNV